MNSSLYRAKVFHDRLEPKKHQFGYQVFYFYLDLDEIDSLAKRFWCISRNRFNAFSFRDKEHLQLPISNPDQTKTTKEHIIDYLAENQYQYDGGKIYLMTNLNVFGYNFNPVSFYFVYSISGEIKNCIVEVGNTFGEMKPYFLDEKCFDGKKFHLNTTKYFYVSPFIDHDTQFDFNITVPNEHLAIGIDDYKDGKRFFISTLTGQRKEITAFRLLWFALRFPLIPIKIISLIHWQALILYFKKIHFHKKTEHQELQRDVFRKKN